VQEHVQASRTEKAAILDKSAARGLREKTMKKILTILTIAILLPASAFAGKKKDSQRNQDLQQSNDPQQWQVPDDTPQSPDGTDWLNAPTPDGSPTLKETSDWLAKVLDEYGGNESTERLFESSIKRAKIDNSCNLSYLELGLGGGGTISKVSVPLGAITSIEIRNNDAGPFVKWETGKLALARYVKLHFASGNTLVEDEKYYYAGFFTMIARRPPPISTAPGAEIPQSPEQMAPRIVKALQHAADLCKTTYKAPDQAKEPF
jgi:hypothetical protein